jgi:hypothetical protein
MTTVGGPNYLGGSVTVLAGVIEVEPLVSLAKCDGVFQPPIRGQGTMGCHQDLPIGDLLLPFVLLGPMASKANINLHVNV